MFQSGKIISDNLSLIFVAVEFIAFLNLKFCKNGASLCIASNNFHIFFNILQYSNYFPPLWTLLALKQMNFKDKTNVTLKNDDENILKGRYSMTKIIKIQTVQNCIQIIIMIKNNHSLSWTQKWERIQNYSLWFKKKSIHINKSISYLIYQED